MSDRFATKLRKMALFTKGKKYQYTTAKLAYALFNLAEKHVVPLLEVHYAKSHHIQIRRDLHFARLYCASGNYTRPGGLFEHMGGCLTCDEENLQNPWLCFRCILQVPHNERGQWYEKAQLLVHLAVTLTRETEATWDAVFIDELPEEL